MPDCLFSLTFLTRHPVVAARLDILAPSVRAQTRIIERFAWLPNAGLLGTAYDYLIRFELQRLFPFSVAGDWFAESALARASKTAGGRDLRSRRRTPHDEIAAQLATARAIQLAYVQFEEPTREEMLQVAGQALVLADLEIQMRSSPLDVRPAMPPTDAVPQLVDLLQITPVQSLGGRALLLNPLLGTKAISADADLISDGRLIDFKLSTTSGFNKRLKGQLLGYLILSRARRRLDPGFPIVEKIGAYFARHGQLWITDVEPILAHPAFAACEEWLLEKAPQFCENEWRAGRRWS